MNDLNLPEPIAAYFSADRRDGRAVARCFTEQGLVTDEKQRYVGPAAIEAWRDTVANRFSYSVDLLKCEARGRQFIVTGRVTGNFPGSPVDLRYMFSLEHDKIAALEITP